MPPHRDNNKLTSSSPAVSVEMVLELDTDLTVRRLITEERMFQQLVCMWSMGVIFYQTYTDEVHKLLGPSHANKITCIVYTSI